MSPRLGTRKTAPAGRPRWLQDQRVEHGWTQKQMHQKVHVHFGWGPESVSLYGDLERGGAAKLSDEDMAYLAGMFDRTLGDVPDAPVVEATPDLAAALMAIAVELRTSREERESTDARLRAAESELRSLRAQLAAVVSPKRPALHETVG